MVLRTEINEPHSHVGVCKPLYPKVSHVMQAIVFKAIFLTYFCEKNFWSTLLFLLSSLHILPHLGEGHFVVISVCN